MNEILYKWMPVLAVLVHAVSALVGADWVFLILAPFVVQVLPL